MTQKYDTVITVGVFDCLHEGHVNLLNEMQKKADKVIVIVHDDLSTFLNKNRFPVQDMQHRMKNLLTLVPFLEIHSVSEPDPSERIKKVIKERPQKETAVYMRGDDWNNFPGIAVVKQLGIPIEYVSYTTGVSTTQIRNELKK